MTESRIRNRADDNIYQWIKYLQKNPTDDAIQEKVVNEYKRLVESLARRYSKNSVIHEDLVQVGMIGLLAAVKRYDPNFGRSFEAFAIPTVLGEIKRYIRDQTWSVHVPRRIKEMGPKIKKAVDELTNVNQSSPSIEDIAKYLEVSEEEVLETMEMGQSYRALSVDMKVDRAFNDGQGMAIIDLIGAKEDDYATVEKRLLLEKVMSVLSKREQAILQYTFFENKNQKETGEILGISQMHVSRLQRRSLKKLREAIPFKNTEVLG